METGQIEDMIGANILPVDREQQQSSQTDETAYATIQVDTFG